MTSSQLADSPTASVLIDYISAAANRYSRVAHSSDSSLVAFGSSNLVALWSAEEDDSTGVFQTLPGHDSLVTCVRFKSRGNCLLSADDKGFLSCWRLVDNKWSCTRVEQAHPNGISALAVHGDYVITGSSDATIVIWKHVFTPEDAKDEFQGIQKIGLKGRFPLDIQMTSLPGSDGVILAVSGTEQDVSIFSLSEDKFVRAASLPGHEGWVKSLAFTHDMSGPSTLTLASGSQDGTIRLWNIEPVVKTKLSDQPSDVLSDDLLDSFEAALGEVAEGEEGGRQISLKRHVFATKNKNGSSVQYSITFDALLIGHEAGITSLAWRPSEPSRPMLLSTSTDSSLILWAPTSVKATASESTSLWINQQRFGDIGGQRLGGFVGAVWARNGADALAWGWACGWRRWRAESQSIGRETWREVNAITGHNGPVRSVSWSPGGEFLISTGPDQTTRIHGDTKSGSRDEFESWHEICRPQVHGYDLVDAVFLGPTRFVSIADEKVARVFDAPRSFISLSKHLGILSESAYGDESERPEAASVPPLGLSNKAVTGADSTEAHFPMPSVFMTQRRPFEGELAVSTLWPEIEKVFGHGYELHAIAASHSGKFVATSCRATSPEHAGIKIYDTKTWQPFGQTLTGHQLTITRIAFSPDDRYILSVSRDRTWCMYELTDGGYVTKKADKSHARIIWDCAWAPENDIFVTASRDKTVKIWHLQDLPSKKQTPRLTIKTKEATTAVALAPASMDKRRLLAVGLENGEVVIYSGSTQEPDKWHERLHLNNSVAHVGQINRMSWRPRQKKDDSSSYQLATCSEDGTLRIIRIQL
ncbi:WD40 repeat-like protein [Fomitiporia mediterranea MF3/22]|uniref:WD40 repeat-like protein n=1 Tax=Fomitiporia mediterranea (strain MF3/22) TaxID=694068 RepID=UPI0004407AC6|nr:WD40 repeat-like protein [Fomitiporia mediterranea MF3/22]EJD01322.1 WD40 repeat-like protein [Fomitiporia mediterranea MF3/22]